MDRADYEWRYYIGGNCSFSNRFGGTIAKITHVEQGVYEAILLRDSDPYKPWSLGMYDESNKAEAVIEKVLEEVWEK